MAVMSRPPINLTQKNLYWHKEHGSDIGRARIKPHPDQTPHARQQKPVEHKIKWMIEIEINGDWQPFKVRTARNHEIKKFANLDRVWEWLYRNGYSPEFVAEKKG